MDPKLFAMLVETFKVELDECHQELVEGLLLLEKSKTTEETQKHLQTLFRVSHNVKGSAKSVGIDSISTVAHQLEDAFSLWREKGHTPTKEEMDNCLKQVDSFLSLMNEYLGNSNSEKKTIKQSAQIKLEDNLLKIPLSRVERANAKANEFVTFRLKISSWLKNLNQAVDQIVNIEDASVRKHENLFKALSELKDDSSQFYGEFSRSLNSLQDELRTMRLLPISHVLSQLDRTVRDVATSLNKDIKLKTTGGDIEIDKSILDLIKYPLQHLIRNAIGHGIEEHEIRKKLNKPIPAILHVNVSHHSGEIKIVVTDDGQGLDVEKITAQAVSKNLIQQKQIETLTTEEKYELIFLSGFSTKTNVTELSGRGVGLDIVKSNIQKAKGSVKVNSEKNKGTTFTIHLPLTLATTRGLFVKVFEHILMLPTLSINTLYQVNLSDLSRVNQQDVMLINNEAIPVLLLSDFLDIPSTRTMPSSEYYDGVMIGEHQQRIILLVDEILDEHDCVIHSLPHPLNKIPYLTGVTLIGSGQLVLVLDPNSLMHDEGSKKYHSLLSISLEKQESKTSHVKPKILIVDDSITTRTLAVHSLETAGFLTENAINGKQALEKLEMDNYDCVCTDLDMPIMDGFELIRQMKASDTLNKLPIIIISSRNGSADQAKGKSLGADAYLVKSQFDSHSLIQLIGTLL